jgi:tetratricopeptide (TPR) repeat protein
MEDYIKMRKFPKLLLSALLICVVSVFAMNASVAYAEVPYKTYTHTGYGYLTETQAAYVPGTSISKIGDTSLVGARDMMITEDGEIYIADTGNKRILVSDLQGNYIKEFGADVLMNPCGIFVTKDKLTYVADRDAEKIFVFDAAGKVVNEYGKPNHPLYGDEMSFMPLKIVVNNAGIMFIICEANMNGIVQISPTDGGTFLGYFGTNYTTLSIIDKFKSIVSTDEQKAKKVSNKPATPDNLAIDEKGLIYTVTRGKQSDNQKSTDDNELKRLNIAGKNIINPDQWDGLPVAVAAGNHDNVYMVSQLGYVYEFSNEGEMLFVFGGSDDGKQRVGLSKKTEAISVDKNDNIYILDSDMNKIQVYKPTEFTGLLHKALYLYSKGRYTESKEPLEEILKINSTFAYSNKAMGRALLQEDNYFEAMKFAKLSYDYTTYSDSFWEIRNIWISNYLIPVVGAILVLMIILRILKRLHKKYGIFNSANEQIIKVKRVPLISRVRYSLYFMKHPIDGSYGVRWEGKASYLSANILLAVFIAINVIYKYYSGFLYKPSIEGYYSVLSDIGTVLIAFLILIGCNYLICTINDGEGSFKQIYCAFVYCLTPYIIFQPVVFLLTHVFTINEKFLIQAPQQLIIAWIVILIFITIKEINNITLKETVKVIALTFFAVLIVLLVAFVLYLLWSQVLDFIQAIGGEAVHRLGF